MKQSSAVGRFEIKNVTIAYFSKKVEPPPILFIIPLVCMSQPIRRLHDATASTIF